MQHVAKIAFVLMLPISLYSFLNFSIVPGGYWIGQKTGAKLTERLGLIRQIIVNNEKSIGEECNLSLSGTEKFLADGAERDPAIARLPISGDQAVEE